MLDRYERHGGKRVDALTAERIQKADADALAVGNCIRSGNAGIGRTMQRTANAVET
jgi:hypothetical protein